MTKWMAPVLALSFVGCVQGHDVDGASGFASSSSAPTGCKAQIESAGDSMPDDLACVGLFSSVADKKLAKGVRPYTPGALLWSDGSQKHRWVYLPEGEKIDASDPDAWVFPVGTTFFKEFRTEDDEKRVETRVYRKLAEGDWVRATYLWNADDTAATRHFGGELPDVDLAGFNYQVPTGTQCNSCHDGHREKVMGFDQVSLGLPGAAGVTLKVLADEDLISPKPEQTRYTLADDGTGQANEVYPFFHANCGVSCHNSQQTAQAYKTGLFLRLKVADFSRPSSTGTDAYRLTKEREASGIWQGVRVVPGSPEDSLMFDLLSHRKEPGTPGKPESVQMPPLGTLVVDEEHLAHVEDWILSLAPSEPVQGLE